MKKFLSLLLALTLVVSMLSAFTVSAAVNTTVFYDASTHEQITSLDGVDSIYATTTFTGRYEDNASVIANHYDKNGKLTAVEFITPVESTIGASVEYTTPEISVADTDIIKIFAWTGVDTIKPLLKFPGVISRNEEIPLPTATVTELDVAEIKEVPLTFAMNFKADPVTEAQLLAYGNWYADYELKINKDVTFNLDGTKDGYLAGQYDSWSPAWVTVPKKDVTLAANTPLKIMETGAETYGKSGLKYTCQEVFDRVKDFDCGVFFTDEFLAANPDIYVTLELRIYNPLNESESYLINSETYEFGTKPEEAEVVDITNAPYAGVYAVKADAATTVSTEIGSTAALAAGETKYVYLLKGANIVGNTNGANLTFYALEGNGLDYLDQVTAEIPLAPSSISELTLSGNYTNAQHPYTDYGATGVAFGPDGSVDVILTAPAAGLYVTQIQFATDAQAQMTVESDTGFYGVINQQAGRVGWNELNQGEHGVGNQDMEIIFLRAGANTITFKNTGAGDTLVTKIKLAKTGSLASLEAYNWQLNVENLKVVVTEATPEEPTPTPEPTPEPTPDVPAEPEGDVVDITNAPYAGVYAVKADAATTVSTEIGSTATIAAGETKYVYLLKGANIVGNTNGANLTFYALEGNGLDYLDQVTAEIPLAPSSISELTLSGNYTNGQHPYTDYGAAGVAFGKNGSVDVTLTAPAAGLYVTQIQFATDAQAQMTVESDTGFYGVINQQAGRVGWNELHQGEHGVGNQDMEIIFLRAGANTITFKNTGAGDTLVTKIKLAKTGSLASLPAYNWQLNVENLKVVEAATEGEITTVPTILTYANVTAEVPAGVLLNAGVTDLTLTTTALENSESGVEAGENEKLSAFDVHVAGVSEENTTPIIVTINEATEKGYNKGNLSLFHVEDGVAVPMEEVETKEDLVKHNQFTYDPADGTISLAMANFSEIALLADTTKVWNGEYDYSWYVGKSSPYTISNADQMAGFSAIVGGMAEGIARDSFNGKTVKLMADLDFGGKEVAEPNDQVGEVFYPVGYYNSEYTYEMTDATITSGFETFEGTFDGNGHTIANIYQSTWIMKGDDEYYAAADQRFRDGMGIFGKVKGATIKNLTVDNFQCDGEYTTTGVIAAYADSGNGNSVVFENIAITNCNPRVYNIGNGGIVGSGGWYSREDKTIENKPILFKNITVDNTNKISALWGSWDVACAGIMGRYYPDSKCGVHFENCHVAAQIDVFNDVCGNYQYYWYRYAGMMIGTVQASVVEDGYTKPDMTGVTAEGCTVHFGDWNNYYYCELVANSLASYTHDHQFSRLTQIQNISEIQDKNGNWTTTGNFILMKGKTPTETCYHIVNKDGVLTQHNHADAGDEIVNGETVLKENNQRVYLPFNQLFQGSGWGVKHIPVYNGEDYAFAGITVLDREVADSVVKFASNGVTSVETETSLTVGDLFKAVDQDEVAIVAENVQVAVSPVIEDNNTANATIAAGATWAESTINFTGIGKVEITITDYYFCTPTTIIVEVVPQSVAKFKPVNATERQVYGANGLQNVTFTLGELFDATAEIDSANVTVTAPGATNIAYDKANWENTTVTYNAVGNYNVTVNDNNYCLDATATATVTKAASVEKFKKVNNATATQAYDEDTVTVALGNLFTANGYTINVNGINITGATFANKSGSDWTKWTITISGTGSKTITINDGDAYGTTVSSSISINGPVAIKKFTAQNPSIRHTLASLNANSIQVALGDIFTGTNNVTGTVSYNVDGVTGTVAAADWKTHKVTVSAGLETVNASIQDSYACIQETGKVTFTEPQTVIKWTPVSPAPVINLTLANYNTTQSINFAQMFTESTAYPIKGRNITVSPSTGVTVNQSTGSVTVPGTTQTYTVKVTDAFYGREATTTIKVNNPTPANKWTVKANPSYEIDAGTTKVVTVGDLFNTNGNTIGGTVEIYVDSTKVVEATKDNWSSKTVTLSGGTHKVGIIDTHFSASLVEATVTVTEKAPVEKFAVKDEYYFVAHDVVNPGSSDVKTIKLGDIFEASGEGTINSANVTVTTSNKVRKIEATINKNASDWTQTTIDLKYSGEITLTITDGSGCIASETIVATAPLWSGDVDGGNSGTAQVHYNSKIKHSITSITLDPGATGTITLNDIPAEGVYGIQWWNGYGIHGTTGTAEFTVNGYSDTSTVTSPNWSDSEKADFLAYLKAGNNTVTVKNIGSTHLSVYLQVNTMSLDKSGYKYEDFMPYLKDGVEGGITPDPTPTPTPTPGGSEPSAPQLLEGAGFTAALTNKSNIDDYGSYIEMGYQKNASFTITLGVETAGTYKLSIKSGSNATYVMNSQVTNVVVDGGASSTTFPQTLTMNGWKESDGSFYLEPGDHTFTLSTNSSWNRFYIYGLQLVKQ